MAAKKITAEKTEYDILDAEGNWYDGGCDSIEQAAEIAADAIREHHTEDVQYEIQQVVRTTVATVGLVHQITAL